MFGVRAVGGAVEYEPDECDGPGFEWAVMKALEYYMLISWKAKLKKIWGGIVRVSAQFRTAHGLNLE